MQMWKPGQIVTICGKRYRIKKEQNGMTCSKCAGRHIIHTSDEPCNTCLNSWKMAPYNYLEKIKPKSVMG